MNQRVIWFSVLAFVLPLGVLLFLRYDDVQEFAKVDPKANPGKVLYFTSPS